MEGQAEDLASAANNKSLQLARKMQPIKLIERIAKYALAVVAGALLWRPHRARKARQALRAPHRILLVRIDNRIGEALLSTPLFRTLKTLDPAPRVDALVHPAVVRVLRDHPDLDRVFALDAKLPRALKLLAELRQLRRTGYDLAFDCGNWSAPSVTSAIVARLAAGRTPVIGPAVWPSSLLHSVSVPATPRSPSEVSQRLQLLSVVPGVRLTQSLSFREPKANEGFKPFLERVREQRFAVLNPGGRLDWRRVPAEAFSSAAKALLSNGVQPVVAWGPGEESLAQDVVRDAPGSLLAPATDLDDLASLLKAAQLSICNNTGPMHLSVALGTPTLGLFLKMDVARWGHLQPPHRMLDLDPVSGSIPGTCEVIVAQVTQMLKSLRESPVKTS